MRILIVTRHFGCLRNFERVIERLAHDGHTVHLAGLHTESAGGQAMVERLAARHAKLTVGFAPSRPDGTELALARQIRLTVDFLRYLGPAYAETPRLRTRSEERTPYGLLRLCRLPGARSTSARWCLTAALHALERAIPRVPEVDMFLTDQHPDVLMLTPLIGLGSSEPDYLVSAKALGLRTMLSVSSWDNLSSKSLIRTIPDTLTVWNETQKAEAVTLHDVPPHKVAVTGAQCFDHWFGRSPARTRTAFCEHVGLRTDRPFLLWVCSALFQGSPSEAAFVVRWVDEIRSSSNTALQQVRILIRPHPARLKQWDTVDLHRLDNVALWGANPIDAEAKTDYFDSFYHSAAVAGLNTSAFLEAAIVGRPVHTILLPEFWENQEGTLHFHYLLTVSGGLLIAARSFDEHRRQLGETLAQGPTRIRRAEFLQQFIRPHGPDVEATTKFVEAVDQLQRQPEPRPASTSGWVDRAAYSGFRAASRLPGAASLLSSPRERVRDDRVKANARQLTQHQRAKKRRGRQLQWLRLKDSVANKATGWLRMRAHRRQQRRQLRQRQWSRAKLLVSSSEFRRAKYESLRQTYVSRRRRG